MKKTKIVATISDKKCDVDFLRELYANGMNVVRLNTAHQTFEDSLKVIRSVREVSDRIALLIDTKGPEIRTTSCENPFPVKKGDIIKITGNPEGATLPEEICVSYSKFSIDVPVGSRILIDDGEIELIVVSNENTSLFCEVMNDGIIKGRKSVNVPKVHFDLPSLSEKDRKYIDFAIEQNVDFIAHSFVRKKEDVMAIQEILDAKGSKIKIIAKIENQSGVDNLDEILDHAYGVMVARGDLAIEIPYEKIPGIQRAIIKKCIERRKPVIIATQMLHTMITNPRPTRAEVSDIANAIYSQTDAIMLSGETAYGAYPVEAMKTMNTVAMEVEKTKGSMNHIPILVINNETSDFLIKSAVIASVQLDVKAIIADSMSGRTIRGLSAYRGNKIIFAECYSQSVVRELALSYGAHAHYIEPIKTSHDFIQTTVRSLLNCETLTYHDKVVVLAGNFGTSKGATYVEIGTVRDLLNIEEKELGH
jgi:pyruvate kinase